jgi:hypothetical protein
MIPDPLNRRRDEPPAVAAERMEKVARDLTVFAEEHAAPRRRLRGARRGVPGARRRTAGRCPVSDYDSPDLFLVDEWSDPDENDGEWPYPTEYHKSLITGELAERCRRALGVTDPNAEVFITERVESGGYSEYTQENFTDFTIECDGKSETFNEDWSLGSTFQQLLKWLDGNL